MPISMSGGYANPSHRARDDESRMRARQARYGLNPGPGTYDPKRQNSTSVEVAGSSAFKSKSDRKTDGSLREVGDPGSYNPYDNMGVAAQSTRSFNKSQSTGSGGFGTKTRRAELSTPNDAPGPGTYDAKLPNSPEAKQGSSFASQTKRGAYLPKQQTPGAGEYDPSMRNLDRVGGGDSVRALRNIVLRELSRALRLGHHRLMRPPRHLPLHLRCRNSHSSPPLSFFRIRCSSRATTASRNRWRSNIRLTSRQARTARSTARSQRASARCGTSPRVPSPRPRCAATCLWAGRDGRESRVGASASDEIRAMAASRFRAQRASEVTHE